MRIGIVCHPTYGGSGVVATELGKSLSKRGHSVHFITYAMPFRLGVTNQNIYYHHVNTPHYAVLKYPPQDLSLSSRIARVAKKHRLDLVHVHYAVPYTICAFLAKQMVNHSFRLITTLHGTDVTMFGEDPLLQEVIEFAINQSDAVTVVSDSLLKQTQDLFSVQVPIRRIYNFIDSDVYYPREMSEERLQYAEPHEKLLLHVSNFRPVKRTKDVISIFHLVQQQIPAKLILAGEGPELPAVKKQIDELKLGSKVLILGKKENVSSLFSLADLLLLPSAKESFGLVAIEAMACGMPVISSNAGGLPEVIKHGQTGYLAEIGDVQSMADFALKLLQTPALYQLFSMRAIQRVRKFFSMSRIVDQYESLYREVLSEKGVKL